MEQGILQGTGKTVTVHNSDGTETVYEIPEQIHTFAAWKSLGFSVKKGEHACAAFCIWKYAAARANREQTATEEETAGEQAENGRMLWKKAFFFKASQVERLKTANA
jgi:hypothetical protein